MNRLKKELLCCSIILGILLTGCSKDDDTELLGNWTKKSSFDGPARSSAVSFVIGNLAYVATGYTGDEYLKDLWVYDSDGDYWEQKANFIGTARSSASGFALDGKGYIGLGYDGTNRLKDFFQYNPASNSWEQKADFGGTARYGAVGFQVGGKAYFGTGYDGNLQKDFYQYNATDNTWTQVNGFSGNKRKNATVFVIGNYAYFGTGINNNVNQVDFWEFNSTTEVWTRKRDIDQDDSDSETFNDDYNILRTNACSFSMNGLGYVACGENSKSIWQYNPLTDLWEEKTALEGSVRTDAVGFSVGESRGYVMLGRVGTSYFDDLWEFKPLQAQDDNDN